MGTNRLSYMVDLTDHRRCGYRIAAAVAKRTAIRRLRYSARRDIIAALDD